MASSDASSPSPSPSKREINWVYLSVPKFQRVWPWFAFITSVLSNEGSCKMSSLADVSYLSSDQAALIDEKLMSPSLGFSIDQLMELAGLSVATAAAEEYPLEKFPRVLIICGPGNNGGDGLVAARHLHHFGYKPTIVYPKQTQKPLYQGLVTQSQSLGIPVESALPDDIDTDFDFILDAIFGFSFKGEVRPPFDTILTRLNKVGVPVMSVDIPSGWDVDSGPPAGGGGLRPAALVSLTAPKRCAAGFAGRHYLGGRFVPPAIRDEFGLRLPPFPGVSMHVRLA